MFKEVPVRTIDFGESGTYQPRNQNEVDALREFGGNVANGGRIIKELPIEAEKQAEKLESEQADVEPAASDKAEQLESEQAEESADSEPADDGQAEASQADDGAYPEITSKAEAAQLLTAAPYSVPVEALKSEHGNLTKEQIRSAAKNYGISFPNL
jgi:hypothetical protein